MYFPFDPLYLVLVLPAFIFSIWAQYKVTNSFNVYSQQRTSRGITGAQAAREVLENAGVYDVQITKTDGKLTDHFDPRSKVISLSENVYNAATVAAVGVAAHEAGHAIQYASEYGPIQARSAIIPITNIGSKLSVPLILIGIFFDFTGLINIGIILFGTVVVFQLITLPVEFNASRRAVKVLSDSALLTPDELDGSKKVLNAAALTYVGALAVSLAQFIRLLAISRRRR